MPKVDTHPSAILLPKGAVPGSKSPVHFPGFPGVFTPGKPISLDELELDAEDAQARIEDAGLPLELVGVDESGFSKMSLAELDELGADFEDYPADAKKADKVAFLASHEAPRSEAAAVVAEDEPAEGGES